VARLKTAGCEKMFREKITGTTVERPQLRKLMAALAHGDVVVIPAVDRLSRDTTDILAGRRGEAGASPDRSSKRTARGRADAKAKGVKFDRKPKLTPHQQREARERLAAGETQRSIPRSYNVNQATISRLAA
jgi:DNA invertase Pin-like site-specific DNA recombinase